MRAHLVERGVLDAETFSRTLGETLRQMPEAQDGGTGYYVAFVAALEECLSTVADGEALKREKAAWHEAAARTPHGQPIALTDKSRT